MSNSEDIIKQLEKKLSTFSIEGTSKNVGVVEKNTDGVIVASGLSKAMMSELVIFENGSQGVVLNLDEDYCSIILLDKATDIKEGDSVKTTGILLSIEVSDALIGRVVGPLGEPLTANQKLKAENICPWNELPPALFKENRLILRSKPALKALIL